MYKLTEFNNGLKGYKISWKELANILCTVVPAQTLENGWYEDWYCYNWEKEINGVNIIEPIFLENHFAIVNSEKRESWDTMII